MPFDFFNDYKDTRGFLLLKGMHTELDILDERYKIYQLLNGSWESNTFENEYTDPVHEDHSSPTRLPTTKRICLRCNKKFKSTGPGNRICPNCTSANNKVHSLKEVKDHPRVSKIKHDF